MRLGYLWNHLIPITSTSPMRSGRKGTLQIQSTKECQLMAPKKIPFSDRAHPLKYHLPRGESGPYFVGLPEEPENMAFVNWFISPVMLVESLLRGCTFRYNIMVLSADYVLKFLTVCL